jgi:hypothetical protein
LVTSRHPAVIVATVTGGRFRSWRLEAGAMLRRGLAAGLEKDGCLVGDGVCATAYVKVSAFDSGLLRVVSP